MRRIFVVDDERNITDLIRKYLEREGFKVTVFNSGENVLREFTRLRPDLLVLDIMMPRMDGLELCRKIRTRDEAVPIIFVSARSEEFDRVLGLELGGDDYLTKPFSPRELVVRIKNIFKRMEKFNSMDNQIIVLKDLKLDISRRYVEKDGREIKFTAKEYELFQFLAQNKDMPFTREQLLEKVWGYDYIGDDRAIDDLVKRIRKKLNSVDSRVKITTIWGYGYRLDG